MQDKVSVVIFDDIDLSFEFINLFPGFTCSPDFRVQRETR